MRCLSIRKALTLTSCGGASTSSLSPIMNFPAGIDTTSVAAPAMDGTGDDAAADGVVPLEPSCLCSQAASARAMPVRASHGGNKNRVIIVQAKVHLRHRSIVRPDLIAVRATEHLPAAGANVFGGGGGGAGQFSTTVA